MIATWAYLTMKAGGMYRLPKSASSPPCRLLALSGPPRGPRNAISWNNKFIVCAFAVGADLSRLPLSAPGSGVADLSAPWMFGYPKYFVKSHYRQTSIGADKFGPYGGNAMIQDG